MSETTPVSRESIVQQAANVVKADIKTKEAEIKKRNQKLTAVQDRIDALAVQMADIVKEQASLKAEASTLANGTVRLRKALQDSQRSLDLFLWDTSAAQPAETPQPLPPLPPQVTPLPQTGSSDVKSNPLLTMPLAEALRAIGPGLRLVGYSSAAKIASRIPYKVDDVQGLIEYLEKRKKTLPSVIGIEEGSKREGSKSVNHTTLRYRFFPKEVSAGDYGRKLCAAWCIAHDITAPMSLPEAAKRAVEWAPKFQKYPVAAEAISGPIASSLKRLRTEDIAYSDLNGVRIEYAGKNKGFLIYALPKDPTCSSSTT